MNDTKKTTREFCLCETLERLNALRAKLEQIRRTQSGEINLFDAVGMQKQEIKHSAFMAWLLTPTAPHRLGTKPLNLLVKKLLTYKSDDGKIKNFRQNDEILAGTGICVDKVKDLFIDGDDVEVLTERAITKEDIDDGRIDIFVENRTRKTLIAVENKVFTSTHDNQLRRYEDEFRDRKDWKKIFVYLSPKGELPFNDKAEYEENWCVLDYRALLSVVKSLTEECGRKQENVKLKFLLKDYSDMVETFILKEKKELQKVCKEIRREYREELKILWQYSSEAIIKYCKEQFRENLGEISFVKERESGLSCVSARVDEFFVKNGENVKLDENRTKFAYGLNCKDGPLLAVISMEKDKEALYSEAQTKIMSVFPPKTQPGKQYCRLYTVTLLTEEETYLEFSEAKKILDEKMTDFFKKVGELERALT